MYVCMYSSLLFIDYTIIMLRTLKVTGYHGVVPENIHTPPTDGQWKFLGDGVGGLKGRNFQVVWGVGHVKNFQEA